MDRYIAIDNVCAWPNLTLMRDGAIVATIFNQPCHGFWEGDVECWGSEDGGRTWKLRGTPVKHEPTTNRMNVSAGLNRNGDLIVLASGWSKRLPIGQPHNHEGSVALQPWVSRSSDGGRTWTVDKSFPVAPEPGMCEIIPFGDILPAADGTLCVSGYAGGLGDRADGYNSSYFYRSRDEGRTWGDGVIIGKGNHNETAPLHLGNGRWLAAVRTLDHQGELVLFASPDDGRTWAYSQHLSMAAQHPAHLLRLADGRILLTYGNRCRGHYGIDVRLSDNEGKSWYAPCQLVDVASHDLGYPSTVQLADGKMVTAYYCGGTAYHARYHMGSVVWDLKELFG
ncbi:MAG: sialidase family protein [Planctomycetota bacterium]|nr:sialidase family protein [Planctomycetota bacterium]